LTFNLYSQMKLDKGTYISDNKLCYVTILDEVNFAYLEYENFSPYTIEQDRKTGKIKPGACGVIGYISKRIGNGCYQIVNGNLQLKFSEFKNYRDNQFDKEKDSLFFDISKMIKI